MPSPQEAWHLSASVFWTEGPSSFQSCHFYHPISGPYCSLVLPLCGWMHAAVGFYRWQGFSVSFRRSNLERCRFHLVCSGKLPTFAPRQIPQSLGCLRWCSCQLGGGLIWKVEEGLIALVGHYCEGNPWLLTKAEIE